MKASLTVVCDGTRHYFRKLAGRWTCTCGATR